MEISFIECDVFPEDNSQEAEKRQAELAGVLVDKIQAAITEALKAGISGPTVIAGMGHITGRICGQFQQVLDAHVPGQINVTARFDEYYDAGFLLGKSLQVTFNPFDHMPGRA